MGAFFTNLQVRNVTTRAVCEALPTVTDSRAYVSPAHNGWITVYPESTEDQNDQTIRDLAGGLSGALKADVLAFLVHDSDIAVYWFYHDGELADEFNSAPDYFGGHVDDYTRARLSGDTGLLLPLCVPGTTHAELDGVLRPPDGHPVFAEEIVGELARLLGIKDPRTNLGFEYFENEGAELLPDVADFEPVGRGAERKAAKLRPDARATNIPIPDSFPFAVAMLTQTWNSEHEKSSAQAGKMLGTSAGDILKQMREGFDRMARDMLKKSSLAGLPTIQELKAARDQGPDALAALIADKTPSQLADIGVSATNNGLEAFLAALLKHGLDPHAPAGNGRTTLRAAEQRGMNSAIYRLVKAAAEGRT
jgi:hypothetical protein